MAGNKISIALFNYALNSVKALLSMLRFEGLEWVDIDNIIAESVNYLIEHENEQVKEFHKEDK